MSFGDGNLKERVAELEAFIREVEAWIENEKLREIYRSRMKELGI